MTSKNCYTFNPLTPGSAKSKINQSSNIANWVKLKKGSTTIRSTAQQLSNEWSHFGVLSLESKDAMMEFSSYSNKQIRMLAPMLLVSSLCSSSSCTDSFQSVFIQTPVKEETIDLQSSDNQTK